MCSLANCWIFLLKKKNFKSFYPSENNCWIYQKDYNPIVFIERKMFFGFWPGKIQSPGNQMYFSFGLSFDIYFQILLRPLQDKKGQNRIVFLLCNFLFLLERHPNTNTFLVFLFVLFFVFLSVFWKKYTRKPEKRFSREESKRLESFSGVKQSNGKEFFSLISKDSGRTVILSGMSADCLRRLCTLVLLDGWRN